MGVSTKGCGVSVEQTIGCELHRGVKRMEVRQWDTYTNSNSNVQKTGTTGTALSHELCMGVPETLSSKVTPH